MISRLRLRTTAIAPPSVDPWLLAALLVTTAGLTVTAIVAINRDLILAFADAASHVVIPRRVFDNPEPGLTQLGTAWAPLFHVLELPFVWIGPLYRSGASGLIVSAIASLATSFYLYRLALLVGAEKYAAFLAAALLAASPSFLYAGVIPALPATIMATTTANIYYLTRWAFTGSGSSLLAAGLALTAATLTHFDTWVLAPVELGVVILTAQRSWSSRRRTEATTLLWLLAGSYGIALFLLMNVMIFGDPLAFTKPFGGTGDLIGAGQRNLGALLNYPYAAWLTAGPVLAVAGMIGTLLFVRRWRRNPRYLITLLLFYPFLFYTIQALASGTFIHPDQELGDWQNLRYGITILPAPAFFVATGIRRPVALGATAIAIVLSATLMVTEGRVAAWEDAEHDVPSQARLEKAGEWLADRAESSLVLIPVHHTLVDRLELVSDLPSQSFIDANDTRAWHRARREALVEPSSVVDSGIRWIVVIGNRGRGLVSAMVRNTSARLCYVRRPVAKPAYLAPIRIYSLERAC